VRAGLVQYSLVSGFAYTRLKSILNRHRAYFNISSLRERATAPAAATGCAKRSIDLISEGSAYGNVDLPLQSKFPFNVRQFAADI
jgi:hypothetical protein